MAAGRPIVSTAVADVVRNFTPVVAVAGSPDEFVALVRRAAESPDAALIARGLEQATAASWETTVARMRALLDGAVRESETRVDDVAAPSVWQERGAASTRAVSGAKEELSA